MSESVVGKIVKICDVKEIGAKGFRIQEFWVEEAKDKYPQTLAFQLVKDKISQLDDASVGDGVTVQYNLRGRVYGDRCFNTLEAWSVRLEGHSSTSVPAKNQRTGVEPSLGMDDDQNVPF